MDAMGEPSPRGRTLRGRIGVALTAVGFIAMIISLLAGEAMPTLVMLTSLLVFVLGILVMMVRGGDDAVESAPTAEADDA